VHSLSTFDACPRGGAKILEIVVPALMAVCLPILPAGLGVIHGLTKGWTVGILYLGLVALVYVPATLRTGVLAARAYRSRNRRDLACYTILPGAIAVAILTPGTSLTIPYAIGIQAALKATGIA
jgi:hypothetical protein